MVGRGGRVCCVRETEEKPLGEGNAFGRGMHGGKAGKAKCTVRTSNSAIRNQVRRKVRVQAQGARSAGHKVSVKGSKDRQRRIAQHHRRRGGEYEHVKVRPAHSACV